MKLYGGNHHWATRRTHPGVHLAPKEKSATGQIQCRTLYSALGMILLSCALFVGTTFAWFSDNSTGATAQIMGGKLSVALEFVEEDEAHSLNNIQFTNSLGSSVWNLKDTFETPLMHVVNTGDLPLEYKLIVIPATELVGMIDFWIEPAEATDSTDSPKLTLSSTEATEALAAAADPEPVAGTPFKIVGTMLDDAVMPDSEPRLVKPFRLIVLARQSDEPYNDDWWPAYCTDESHNALKEIDGYPDISGITVSHDPVKPCRLIYACSECGEVLEKDVLDQKIHSDQAEAQFDALVVGTEFVSSDWERKDNTYTKSLKCDYCHESIGKLTVTTVTPKPDEETEQPTEQTNEIEIIASVEFESHSAGIPNLSKSN